MRKRLLKVLGCSGRTLPSTYLNLLLEAPFKSTQIWNVIEERFQK